MVQYLVSTTIFTDKRIHPHDISSLVYMHMRIRTTPDAITLEHKMDYCIIAFGCGSKLKRQLALSTHLSCLYVTFYVKHTLLRYQLVGVHPA